MKQINSVKAGDERGAVAVTVAISMIVLLGLSAIAIDGGRGMTERREARNAADHAALTAAWSSCQWSAESSTYANPVAAGLAEGAATATENGYDGVANNTVTVAFIGDLTLTPPEHRYEVTINSDIDGTFSKAFGAGDIVSATGYAIANCDSITGPGDYAIFARAGGCGPIELNLTGSSQTIIGGIHSNGELKISGNAADPSNIYGPVSYVEDIALSSVNLWDDLAPPGVNEGFPFVSPTLPFPSVVLNFGIGRYAPGGDRAIQAATLPSVYVSYVGNQNWSGINLAAGLYYVAGNLRMHNVTGEGVTIVATGSIDITGTTAVNTTTDPWDPFGLSLFSNYKASTGPACNTNAIKWSASNSTWGGIQYAPNGAIDMSAASNNVYDGSLLAYTVNLSGSDISFTSTASASGTTRVVLELED